MLKSIGALIIFFCLIYFSFDSFAESKMGKARLFLGSTQTKPEELNTDLTAQSLKEATLNNSFGVEITFPFSDRFNAGLRYAKRVISQDEVNGSSVTDYRVAIDQDIMAAIGRYLFYKGDIFNVDAVLGVGIGNSKYEIKSATQDGSMTKQGSSYSMGGIGVSIGSGKYHFLMEAGYDSQKLSDFKETGTLNGNISSIDLSGPYFTIGFLFDGIPISM